MGLQQCASDIKHFRLQDFEISGTPRVSQHPGFECGVISSALLSDKPVAAFAASEQNHAKMLTHVVYNIGT